MDHDSPPDIHIQHSQPPIYYCWKYWLTTGEIHEGCTPVNEESTSFLPDLNDYGWVYMAVPLVGFFLLVFFFYVCCRGGASDHESKDKKPLLSSEFSSEDDEFFSTYGRAKAYAGATAPVVRNGDARNYYTEVHMDHGTNNIIPHHMEPGGYYVQPNMHPKIPTANFSEVDIHKSKLKKAPKIRDTKSDTDESIM